MMETTVEHLLSIGCCDGCIYLALSESIEPVNRPCVYCADCLTIDSLPKVKEALSAFSKDHSLKINISFPIVVILRLKLLDLYLQTHLNAKPFLRSKILDNLVVPDRVRNNLSVNLEFEHAYREDKFAIAVLQSKKRTRDNVLKALDSISFEELKQHIGFPPPSLSKPCSLKVACVSDSLFVGGRYLKNSRKISQTPFIRKLFPTSVQELVAPEIVAAFGAKDYKFVTSGREDADVRMLGTGRPFYIQLINAKRTTFDLEFVDKEKVKAMELKIVSKGDLKRIKEGEISKKKHYRCLVRCEEGAIPSDAIDELNKIGLQDFTIQQKTPIRVVHRRSNLIREKTIHSMKASLQEGYLILDLITQAGTYVKEFVHGDLSRTTPSITSILNKQCDIIALDVIHIDLQWP